MAAPVAYAGLAVVGFGIGMSSRKKAREAERQAKIRAAWADYGMSAFEFEKSREQQKKYHVETMTEARTKLGASGTRVGTQQWRNVIGKYERENRQRMAEIQKREDEWKATSNYQLALSVYEGQTSVHDISRQYGLRGLSGKSAGKGRRNPDQFDYRKYDYSDPLIPGYVGHTRNIGRGQRTEDVYEPLELTAEYVQRNPRRKTQPGDRRQARIVSRGFYEAARPTMDEFYWINYSGDKTKAAEAKAAIQQRADEYIATYGSIIAMGPYEGVTGPDRKIKIMQ